MGKALSFAVFFAVIVIVASFWWGTRALENAVNPAPEDVYFLQGLDQDAGDIVVLLHPVATGGSAQLIYDPALIAAARDSVYITDRNPVGEGLGTFALAMLGGQNLTPVVSVFQGRERVAHYDCNINECRPDGWLAQDYTRELSAFDGAGQTAVHRRETFFDYDTYAAAHTNAVADPLAVFASADGLTLASPRAATRDYRLLMPTQLIQIAPDAMPADVDTNVLRDQITTLVAPVVAEAGGTIEDASINVFPAPFVTNANGFAATEAEVRVAGYALATPNFIVRLPDGAAAGFEAAMSDLDLPPYDKALAVDIVAAAVAAEGLPPCDICVLDPSRAQQAVSLNAFADPGWTLDYYTASP